MGKIRCFIAAGALLGIAIKGTSLAQQEVSQPKKIKTEEIAAVINPILSNLHIGWAKAGEHGRGEADVNNSNIFVGIGNFDVNKTGSNNVAVGVAAMNASKGDSVSASNTAIGEASLFSCYACGNNTAVGQQSGRNLTTGANDVAIGYNALYGGAVGVSGQWNTAIGAQALFSTTQGGNNTAVGGNSLKANENGHDNTAIGLSSLSTNTAGNGNVAIGEALGQNITGSGNIAIGNGALGSNLNGNFSVALGTNALKSATGEAANTAIGTGALMSNVAGIGNTALGYQACSTVTRGSGNVCLGYYAGDSLSESESSSFAAGGDALPIRHVYFGNGKQNANPVTYTIHGTASTKSGTPGGDIILDAGLGNGAGANGSVTLKSGPARIATASEDGLILAPTQNHKCDLNHRGQFQYFAGKQGEKDKLLICIKDEQDRYAWHTIY